MSFIISCYCCPLKSYYYNKYFTCSYFTSFCNSTYERKHSNKFYMLKLYKTFPKPTPPIVPQLPMGINSHCNVPRIAPIVTYAFMSWAMLLITYNNNFLYDMQHQPSLKVLTRISVPVYCNISTVMKYVKER